MFIHSKREVGKRCDFYCSAYFLGIKTTLMSSICPVIHPPLTWESCEFLVLGFDVLKGIDEAHNSGPGEPILKMLETVFDMWKYSCFQPNIYNDSSSGMRVSARYILCFEDSDETFSEIRGLECLAFKWIIKS